MNNETESPEMTGVEATMTAESTAVKQREISPEQKKIMDRARPLSTFVFAEEMFEALGIAKDLGRNVFFYGPGGHGKSEGVVAWFNNHGIKPFVVACHADMSIQELFGGLDIKCFNETGALKAKTELSFMMHPFVIFEELGDLPTECLAALKDCLASGEFRNGDQCVPLTTEFIVGNSNRTSDEIGKNQSLQAAMERFPIQLEVKWAGYEAKHYAELFKAVKGTLGNPMLTTIIQAVNVGTKRNISPRIALVAFDAFEKYGVGALKYVKGFEGREAKTIIANMLEEIKSLAVVDTICEGIVTVEKTFIQVREAIAKGIGNQKDLNSVKTEIDSLTKKLEAIKIPDDAKMLKGRCTEAKTKLKVLSADAEKEVVAQSMSGTFDDMLKNLDLQF